MSNWNDKTDYEKQNEASIRYHQLRQESGGQKKLQSQPPKKGGCGSVFFAILIIFGIALAYGYATENQGNSQPEQSGCNNETENEVFCK